jgi:hypothetical protein
MHNSKSEKSKHDKYFGQLESLFRGTLSVKRQNAVHEHVRVCEECQQAYQKWSGAEAALYDDASENPLNPAQLGRISRRLFAEEPKPKVQRWTVVSGIAGLAASCLLLFAIARSSSVDDFQARSGDEATTSAKVSLRALRIDNPDSANPGVEDITSAGQVLHTGDKLVILYTNLEDYRYMHVTYQTSDGATVEWVPISRIQAGVQDSKIGPVIEITAEWPTGPFEITAWFSKGKTADNNGLASNVQRAASDSTSTSRIIRSEIGTPGGID